MILEYIGLKKILLMGIDIYISFSQKELLYGYIENKFKGRDEDYFGPDGFEN